MVNRPDIDVNSKNPGADIYEVAFEETFRKIHPIAIRLVLNRINKQDRHLKKLMSFALENQTASEYPFVFKYSFCNKEQDAKKVNTLAAAVHLLQTSTFITDDIFDASETRDYQRTIYRKYGASYAVIVAELLQSIGLECVSSELQQRRFASEGLVLKIFNQIVSDLYYGQYLDIHNSSNVSVSTRDYYRVISLGAGRFFANLARCGALLASKPRADIEGLTRYGYFYGMALFITDDVVDIVKMPAITGKSFASDLRGRRMRLPIIMALRLASRNDAHLLRNFLRRKSSYPRINHVAKLIQECGAVDACKVIAKRYLHRSLKCLSGMKRSLTVESLRWLSESLIEAQGLNE